MPSPPPGDPPSPQQRSSKKQRRASTKPDPANAPTYFDVYGKQVDPEAGDAAAVVTVKFWSFLTCGVECRPQHRLQAAAVLTTLPRCKSNAQLRFSRN